jgi:hypothetical protein
MNSRTGDRIFRSFFGVTPDICSTVWNLLLDKHPTGCEPKHLLMALRFLKGYCTEHENASLFHVDEKTYRKWQWIYVKLIANLDIVSFISFNI